jgi:hypothetical protein
MRGSACLSDASVAARLDADGAARQVSVGHIHAMVPSVRDAAAAGDASDATTDARGLVVAGVHEFLGEAGPPLGLLARLAGRIVAAARREGRGDDDTVTWIGRRAWPDLPALTRLGMASGVDLPSVSLFVDPANAAGRWWAAERAIRSGAACCVVLDAAGGTLTMTRRLHLAALDAGVTVLLARDLTESSRPSAAMTRWGVRRLAPVALEHSPSRHRHARWQLDLLRCKGRQVFNPSGDPEAVRRAQAGTLASWTLEWDHVHGPVDLSSNLAHGSRSTKTSPPKRREPSTRHAPDSGRTPRWPAEDRRHRMRAVPSPRRAARYGAG